MNCNCSGGWTVESTLIDVVRDLQRKTLPRSFLKDAGRKLRKKVSLIYLQLLAFKFCADPLLRSVPRSRRVSMSGRKCNSENRSNKNCTHRSEWMSVF